MKAARIEKFGDRDTINIMDIDKPDPAENEVLVEVHSSSVNPADIKVMKGIMVKSPPVKFPMTLGMDIAGVVSAFGPGVRGFREGDMVYGQSRAWADGSGAYAEYATSSVDVIAKMPENSGFTEAGTLPLTGVSATVVIYDHIKLKEGQRLLILGGAGGIGSLAIQIAKNIGAFIVTTGTGEEIEFERSLGADETIDYKAQDFEKVYQDFDAVFDAVGGEYTSRAFKVLRKGGILVSMVQEPDVDLAQKHQVTAVMQHTNVNTENLSRLTKFYEDSVLKVHIDKSYKLDQIKEAIAAKETGPILGKIVINIR